MHDDSAAGAPRIRGQQLGDEFGAGTITDSTIEQSRLAPMTVPSGPRRIAGDAALLAAVAIAAANSFWTAYNIEMGRIMVVALVVFVAAVLTRRVLTPPHPFTITGAIVVEFAMVVFDPPIENVVAARWFPVVFWVAAIASVLVVVALWLDGVWQRRLLLGSGLLSVVAIVASVTASLRPEIDVWVIFQQATAGLLEGKNPYAQVFFGVPWGQTDDCFNYLPATFLLTAPARWLLGDVRYGEVAIWLLGFVMLAVALIRAVAGKWLPRVSRFSRGGSGVAMVLLLVALMMPGTLRVAQQAWNESLVLGCLWAAIALLVANKPSWAIVPLALAIATKQHMLLVLPLWALWPAFGWRRTLYAIGGALVISLPWMLADWGRFYQCTVTFFTSSPSRPDSVSFFRYLPDGIASPAVVAAVLVAYLLVWLCLRRTVADLVVAMAVVWIGFDTVNKQSFENQWWLAAVLVVTSLALAAFAQGQSGRTVDRHDAGSTPLPRA